MKTYNYKGLVQWFIYSTLTFVILIPSEMVFYNKLSLALLFGSLLGMLNEIITQLKKLNNKK